MKMCVTYVSHVYAPKQRPAPRLPTPVTTSLTITLALFLVASAGASTTCMSKSGWKCNDLSRMPCD